MNPNLLPLQFKRGLLQNLPSSAYPGEPLITLDTFELFFGGLDGKPQKITDVIFSETEPSSNDNNKLWIDLVSKTIKVRINDKWIPVSNNYDNKIKENLSEQITDVNKYNFYTSHSFNELSIRIVLNGLEQTIGINNDFTIIKDENDNCIGIQVSNDIPLIYNDVLIIEYNIFYK